MTGLLHGAGLNHGDGLTDGVERMEWQGLVERPDGADPRFTRGLVLDVGNTLTDQGYPAMKDWNSRAFVELQQSLHGFLYGPATGGRR